MRTPVTYTDLSIIYYTSNYLEEHNPYFLANTKRILREAIADTKLISVSHKPCDMGENICVGDIGRSNRNIYWQILTGAKAAKTKYVAMAEDDVLYPARHFECRPSADDVFAYDMNKWSVFTWSKPMVYSWRDRMIIFTLVCARDLLIDSLEERLAKYPSYDNQFCGEPGRWENALKIKPRKSEKLWAGDPMVVYSHPHALGYVSTPHGRTRPVGDRKALGPLRGNYLVPWGSVHACMKLWDADYSYKQCPSCGQEIE